MSPTPHVPPDEDDDLLSDLPELDGENLDEEPFEPEDDADFEMELDEQERLSPADLEAGLDEAEASEGELAGDGEEQDWVAGSEAEDDPDLHADEQLISGQEDGWLDGGEPAEDDGAFDDDDVGDFGAEAERGDDGEDGFADEAHDLSADEGPLPALTVGHDDEEGFDEAGDGALELSLSDDDDEAERPSDIEMWPGVRFRFVPRGRVALACELSQPMATGYYAADGECLYALRQGALYALSERAFALAAQPSGPAWTAIAAAGGHVWAASPGALFEGRPTGLEGSAPAGEGLRFAEVLRLPTYSPLETGSLPGAVQLQATSDGGVFLCRGQGLQRIEPDFGRAVSVDTGHPVVLWAAGGTASVVVQGAAGPLLWSSDGGRRFSELPLPADGLSDLWVSEGVVVVATTQGILASAGGDWLQLLPPSTTLCALALGPGGPRVFGCAAHPAGWAVVTRACRDPNRRPRVVAELPPELGAPVFLAVARVGDSTVIHVVAEQGVRRLVVWDG